MKPTLEQKAGWRWVASVGAVVALALALSACGIGGEEETASGQAGGGTDEASEAGLEFAACMRENGVDVPDPEPGSGGGFTIGADDDLDPTAPEFQRAEEACQHILENAISDEIERPTEIPKGALDYAACMREQGIDFPDPVLENGMIKIGPKEDVPLDDPAMRAADEECRDLMPMEEASAEAPPAP